MTFAVIVLPRQVSVVGYIFVNGSTLSDFSARIVEEERPSESRHRLVSLTFFVIFTLLRCGQNPKKNNCN